MSLLDLYNRRQSSGKYIENKPLEESKLLRIIEAGRLAPSACNSQPWSFVVVDEDGLRQQVGKACHGKFIGINKFV